ncbi:regulator of CtrA degradation [Sphingomonas sp. UYP23]
MRGNRQDLRMQRRVIDTLYIDAMVLADEARSYFDEGGRADREALDPIARVAFSCESLKVTTRLMHVIAWLLTQRAVEAGEMLPHDALDPSRRLGTAPATDPAALEHMPQSARSLIAASVELHGRVARLDDSSAGDGLALESPVRSLHQRLAMAF